MLRFLITTLVLFFQLSAYSIEKIDSSRYFYAQNAPNNLTVEQLVEYLKKGAIDDIKTVETFFYWIGLNIEYDLELKSQVILTKEDVSTEAVLRKKKTICSGYSNLFFDMCKFANIECVIIEGVVSYYLDSPIDSINHAWNAVKVGNQWHLVDATWGSGGFSFGSDNFSKNLDLKYLFADPNFFIIDHFPKQEEWQLLTKPINFKNFQSEEWKEKRFRKINNLLDDEEYKNFKQIMKNNGWE